MGRYGQKHNRKVGRSRYAGDELPPGRRLKNSGVNRVVIGMLVIAAIAGGFFLFKISEQALDVDAVIAFLKKSSLDKLIASDTAPPTHKVEFVDKDKQAAASKPDDDSSGIAPYELKEDVVLPTLASSDEPVREAVIAAMPSMAPYVQSGHLIRSYMQIANDFSQGIRVAKHFAFLKLAEPFTVETGAGKRVIAANSYHRYDKLAQAVAAIDESGFIAVYKKFRPLMLQVFSEFSYPDGHNLDDIFIGAARQILSAPIVDKPIEVTKQAVLYKFADPKLEALNPVHKQMLRMGAENTRLIQNKVRGLIAELVNPKSEHALPGSDKDKAGQ